MPKLIHTTLANENKKPFFVFVSAIKYVVHYDTRDNLCMINLVGGKVVVVDTQDEILRKSRAR